MFSPHRLIVEKTDRLPVLGLSFRKRAQEARAAGRAQLAHGGLIC